MPETSDDRAAHIRWLMAKQALDRRIAAAPLIHYAPHRGQKRVHEGCKVSRITLVASGNRFGKSHSNAAEALATAIGYRPWEVPNLELDDKGHYPHRNRIPREHWVLRADGLPVALPNKTRIVTGLSMVEGIGNVMWPKIESMLTPAMRRECSIRSVAGVPQQVTLPNGSRFVMGSAEQKPMMFEGGDYARALLDEPPSRAIWAPIWRGLTDQMGTVLITATPIGPAAPWLYDSMVMGDLAPFVTQVYGSIHDNPHISDEAKKEFLEGGGFTEEERQAREHGAWTALTFRAFTMFDPAAHIMPRREVPRGWIRMCICDPAHRRPYAFVWMAIEPRPGGQIWIYDEWPDNDHSLMRSSTLTIPDYKDVIIQREGGAYINHRVLDPRFGKAKPRIKGEVHTTIQQDFAKEKLYFDCRLEGTEAEETGIERIRAALRYDKNAPISELNRPRLRVMEHCRNSIAALQLSNFVPPNARDADNLPEKLNEKYKDFRDCIRYGILYPWLPPGALDGDSYIDEDDLAQDNDFESDWF